MRIKIYYLFTAFLLVAVLSSCASRKSFLYLQDSESVPSKVDLYGGLLEPDDNLLITVTADEPELASPYNLMFLNARSTETTTARNTELLTYLVDEKGEIDFPVLGKIKVAGITRSEVEDKIKLLLKPYLNNPGVNVRIMNFKISVLGEVKTPGRQSISGERITLLEAIAAAGDLTVYGKRNNIMLLREEAGVRTIAEIDITATDFINSPYYFLSRNDVVYVQPNKTRINSSVIGPNLTVGISAISLLITIISLTTR